MGTLSSCSRFPRTAAISTAPQVDPTQPRSLNRREFLQLSALGAAGVAAGTSAEHKGKGRVATRARRHGPPAPPRVVDTKLASGVIVPTAPWLIAENARPGTLNWICNHVQPDHALEGFANQVSAVPGDDVALFVNTTASAVQAQVYRMGYYQGLGGRLVLPDRLRRRPPRSRLPSPTASAP